jgi:hypothetical protein
MHRQHHNPEYWDKVQALDMWTNREDPVMTCLPLGLPRQGPPTRIFHTDADITIFWRGGLDGGAMKPPASARSQGISMTRIAASCQ